jgi:hypothetical protein
MSVHTKEQTELSPIECVCEDLAKVCFVCVCVCVLPIKCVCEDLAKVYVCECFVCLSLIECMHKSRCVYIFGLNVCIRIQNHSASRSSEKRYTLQKESPT